MNAGRTGRGRRGGGKKKTASTKNAVLRVASDRTSVLVPQQHRRVQGLTLYLAGAVANGAVLADILRQCSGAAAGDDQLLRRITIERRDNDWDAPATEFRLIHEDLLAEALRSCHALEEISIMGLTSSVQNVCEALCELPKLGSLTLKADPHYSSSNHRGHALPPPLLSPPTLRRLLQTVQHRLSLAGVFPESPDYTSVLHEAFVQQGCRLHIFVHFSGTHKQPSPYAYFLRDMMQLNQMGRLQQQQAPGATPGAAANNMWKLLQHVRRRSTSLDAAYVLIRENPWLCHPRPPNEKTKQKRGWKGKIMGLVARVRGRTR